MATSAEFENQAYQNDNIQSKILAEFKRISQQFPERFPKPVYVLTAVNAYVNGQWEERLREIKNDQIGERVTLIPYNSEDCHWIGVLLEFDGDEQIERAEFIDPVKQSHFVPDKLQKQFAKVYPDVILQSRNLKKDHDQQRSATLTIDNLIDAASQAQSTHVKRNDSARTHDQSFDDDNTSAPVLPTPKGNVSDLCDSEQTSSSELERLKNLSTFKSSMEVLGSEQLIGQYKTQKIDDNSELEEEPLETPEEFQNKKEPICSSKSTTITRDNDDCSKMESYEVLKKQLEDGLIDHDIRSKEDLKQCIKEKKQQIQSLRNEGKHNALRKRQISLLSLEQFQLLVDKIEAIESSQSNNDYEVLRKQFEDGLAEHDISSEKELKQRIIEKKEVIQSLKNEGRHNLVRRRQTSLSELEQLQLLADKIELIKPSHSNVIRTKLEEQLGINHPIDQQLELPEMEKVVNINTYSMKEESLVTEENLRNMYKDFSSMPFCAERSIISLLFYVSLKLADNAIILDHTIKLPDQIETEMSKELEYLEKRLRIEELESTEVRYSLKAVSVNIKNKNWKCALTVLRQVFKELHPLDMQELFRLVEKVDDAAHLIKDKEIILFLGGTGSGKSTTIHFLSGSKMVEQEVEGLIHIAPAGVKNSQLKKITTSPFSQSETRYIIPITVNFEDVGAYSNGSIILCDSPGFVDTSGPEVDIANGFGIVKAIRGCKSVKPVVLCSFKGIGDRCSGVKDLAHVLTGLVPGIKDHIKAFSYIFTKFPDRERKTIQALLKDINNKLSETEKADTSFTTFLRDILQKTKNGARVLNPIDDNPGDILDELTATAVILNPEDVFQFYITEKSKAIAQEHVRKTQLSIMSAAKCSEYLFVKYKLDQLKHLNELISQNYIKQIYQECVRYITKHLSEEYEEGISAINRAIMNQTLLTNEDIQEYQTRIEHAKLAEELRKEHLGKEVVHSSALTQYLNQQVDIMLKDLQKKVINDMSVKISLDKIKLLSNSFPDIDYKYKNACQLFTEKFESVVRSFKSSVLSNKFDKSASDIMVVSDALTILQNHLDSEYMKTKYVELKEYFLKYLHDSVEQLNNIFGPEKLEKSDTDKLNSCVCMLESVNNTFTLQPYISKEAVSQIYETLLSRILNYVEEIIKKINTQFKNEMSFHLLEQHMIELDLIRTISIIEPKTAQSYCGILEKLVGYVHESRRDIEQQLGILFRREGRVDYDKLTTCLSSLKSAGWIEKYRSEVYSDVMNNVEQQLIRYVKELKESVMEVSLDLDNCDKIEPTYTIISEINDMKHLEKTVPGVGEHIDEVNDWYIRVTKAVFITIKDTFSIEKWKEQGHQSVDFNKAEKALHYLDACKKTRASFTSECMSVLNGLEECVRYFCNFIQKEMENCFEKIKEYENKAKEGIFTETRIFASYLKEISEIEATYSRVFSCFPNKRIVAYWQDELSNYLTELFDEMRALAATQRTETLSTKLLVAKALSKLDSFLQGEKYIDVYSKYQTIFFSQTNDVCRQVIDAIKDTDYERVAVEMVVLQSLNDVGEYFFKQAKRTLIVGLNNLMEETQTEAIMLGNNIDIQEVRSIVEKLKRLQRAKQFVSQFLDTPDEIDKCIKEVKKVIEEQIKRFLEGITALITVNNFYEANKKIDSITLVRTLLGNYCTEDVVRQIEVVKQSQKNVVLNDVVSKYSQMDISGYTLHPPTDIFTKIEEVSKANAIYAEALSTIKENILAKFREELEKAKREQPPNSENIYIRKFESAVKYLPDAMRDALEVELQHSKDDITRLIQVNDTNLDKAFNSRDLRSIRNVLEEYQNSDGMQSYLNRGRELVLKQVQEIALKITQNFEKGDIIEALCNVKNLYDYKIELENIVVEIRKTYLEVRSQIQNTFQEAYICFINRFLNSNLSIVTDEMIETVKKSFICLIELMKFRYDHNGRSILTHMLPEDFNEKINAFNKNILQYSTKHQNNYNDALQKLDIASLKDCVDKVKRWNSLFIKMKSYDNIHSINDPSANAIVKAITDLPSYLQMLESVSHKIRELRDELTNQVLINSDTNEFTKQRDEFYKKLNEKFLILNKAKLFDTYEMNIDINQIEHECLESLERKITEITTMIDSFIERFSSDSRLTQQEYDRFHLYYSNLLSFKQEMKLKDFDINKKIEKINKTFFDKIRAWEDVIESGTTIDNIAISLINMKRASNNIPSFKIRINERIDEVLNHYKSKTKDSGMFGKLGTILIQDKYGIGQSIIAEHNAFQGIPVSIFNEKTQKHGIDYVLNNLNGDLIDKNKLKNRFEEFRKIYENLIKENLKSNIQLERLIADTKLITGDIKQTPQNVDWDANLRSKVPKLMAHIFALWTLKNADHYFEAGEVENKKSYLLQPHAAQIISILRMLGIGDKDEKLSNNLVQIGTGEGKSVTLGATACLLALFGFDVYCACYSEYLSERDYTAFLSLFDSLGLTNYIHYGSFNRLCEDMINENGDIRQTVEQLISKGLNNTIQSSQQIKRAKILLIDEVDVFFSRDFYGNVYTPSASLRDPTITSLVNFIWTQRQRRPKLNLNQVKATAQYKACCNRYPNWEELVQEAVKDMLFDVDNFESHGYVVNQNKIGYIEQDSIVYNVVYGYKTLFAYHCEHENGKISKESLEENISIKIKCGSFSYAEIPLQFKYIMGVTGTLQSLSDPEKRVIQEMYKISKNTFTPSVFGQNNLKFIEKDDIMIENSDDYFNVIRREIDDRLKGKSSDKRAVLVLFESEQKLKEFYNSKALEPIKESVVYLTEEASVVEKESLITRASTSGQITLLTRTFGRGTDFICHDQTVSANGGSHVIQTFLSEEVSEEVQIKGRTARQGDHGSYSMILLDRDLEKFQIEREHIEDIKKGKGTLERISIALSKTKKYDTVYGLLNDKRIGLFKTQYEANMKYVHLAKERHKIGQNFLRSLNSGDTNSVRKFLVEENKGVGGVWNSRTVCLMDATGSMFHLLHKCKNTVGIMFERASQILKENSISSDSFQIQFVVYRNYNSSADKILQSSPWETRPDNLRAFMNTIEVEGGWNNEAIEIGLWYANKENERENITQVILIGDAPPNSRIEVKNRRESFGENYWRKTNFAQPTYYEDELAKLTSNQIPVHAFYVQTSAEATFKAIASRTGGRCELLDINSSNGADMLTDLVTEEILRSCTDGAKGNALVDAYRKKYGKSHI